MNIHDNLLKAISNSLNVTVEHFLGSGYYGNAYATTDGRVLKITRDESEYAMGMQLKEKNYRHIVRIDDAFIIQTADRELYALIEEKLEIPKELKTFLSDTYLGHTLRSYSQGGQDKRDVLSKIDKARELYPEHSKWVDQMWALYQDCMDAGFVNVDSHNENIGMKDGIIKLFDTGWSGNTITKRENVLQISY